MMYHKILFALFVPFLVLLPGGVFAQQGSQISIGLTVTNDVTPPSVPTGLSASAFSSSQIDLSWTASTDNISVAGYVVRRGGTIVATSTGVTYSDTGLTASTLYSYTVEAFDSSLNYSGQSGSASATTNAPGGGGGGDTTPPTAISFTPANAATGVAANATLSFTMSELVNRIGGDITIRRYADNSAHEVISVTGSQVTMLGTVVTIVPNIAFSSNTQYYVEISAGSFADPSNNQFSGILGVGTWSFTTTDNVAPQILGVVSTTTYTTAQVTFTTNENALATFSWGTTTDYALGTQSEVVYGTNHAFSVSGLSTSTTYYFRIVALDASTNQSTQTGNFTTNTPPPPVDTTPPANVTDLVATPSYTTVSLTWDNPLDPDFSVVRVLRSLSTYPADPNDGVLVYQGSGESVTDAGLATTTTYFYSVFSRDLTGNYSSGGVTFAVTLDDSPSPPPPPPPPPPPTPPTPTPTPSPVGTTPPSPSPGGSTPPPPAATSTGPFVNFPATGTPDQAIVSLTLGDFIFSQSGEGIQKVGADRAVVVIDGTRPTTVSVSYDRMPEVLKTIILTVADPNDSQKTSSYLLRVDQARSIFGAELGVFSVDGDHPFTITVLDHENKGMRSVSGVLRVSLPKKITIVPLAVREAVEETIAYIEEPVRNVAPVAAPVGIAVGASQAVLIATNAGSLYDIYLLFLKLLGLLTGAFRRKKQAPWGVVYDSVTKRPLDPAYVIAQYRDSKQSKGEAITDLDGRYGFMLNPGEYTIVANKTHYKFPSEKLQGRSRDEFYENLYFGDPFQVREGSLVKYDIPLDPIEFDWNEFAKNQDKVFKVYSRNERVRLMIFNVLFFGGLAMSAISYIVTPTLLNAGIVFVYAAILVFQIFWKATHHITRIVNKETGKPIPFALVKVLLPGMNTVIKKAVADELGRFFFLVPPGKYYITVEQKLADGTYQKVLETPVQELSGGVIRDDLLV